MQANLNFSRYEHSPLQGSEEKVASTPLAQVWAPYLGVRDTMTCAVHFDSIATHIVKYIEHERVHYVMGCVAWCTHELILETLAKKPGVSLIVQKESFLKDSFLKKTSNLSAVASIKHADDTTRSISCIENIHPVTRFSSHWYSAKPKLTYGQTLRQAYSRLKPISALFDQRMFTEKLLEEPAWMAVQAYKQMRIICGDTRIQESVRCAGTTAATATTATHENPNEKSPNIMQNLPRMHHKFIVLCDKSAQPFAVLLGSFNYTKNATKSFEDMLMLEHPMLARAYLAEWAQMYIRSEEL